MNVNGSSQSARKASGPVKREIAQCNAGTNHRDHTCEKSNALDAHQSIVLITGISQQ